MSEYYMMDSWGLDNDEPTLKPLDVDFDDWEDDYGINDDNVEFWLGKPMNHLGMPDPIEMEWDDEIAGGGIVWETEGQPSIGPRSEEGVRMKWAYNASDPPLFHKDLVAALRECGVDNIETHKVQIVDRKTGNVCEDYLAINLVGLVKAVDMNKSKAAVHTDDGLIDTDFDSVAINEKAAKGSKMFRLAESVNAIVVHRSVKEYLEAKGGFELTFTEPKNWVG